MASGVSSLGRPALISAARAPKVDAQPGAPVHEPVPQLVLPIELVAADDSGLDLPWVLSGATLGDEVLEVGPGPGLTTDFLKERVSRLTTIEYDPRLADRLRERLAGTNVAVVTGDATKMPFEPDRFSAVASFTMLHHLPSRMPRTPWYARPFGSCGRADGSSVPTAARSSFSAPPICSTR